MEQMLLEFGIIIGKLVLQNKEEIASALVQLFTKKDEPTSEEWDKLMKLLSKSYKDYTGHEPPG